MRAIRITEFGGPEVLTLADVPEPEPGQGTSVVDVTCAGVNFADTHRVEDSYLSRTELPYVPGLEVVGTTPDGRRVAALVDGGGYAERTAVREGSWFEVPDGVTDGAAAALLVQGLTAWHLLHTSARLAEGESVVVHAAAGGTGSLAVQLARDVGAGRVIALASSADKRDLAISLGADVAVDPATEGLTDRLVEANDGRPVDVVLEMTGGEVFDASLAALAPFGRLVHFGMASRQAPRPVNPGELMLASRTVSGFWLQHLLGRPEMLGAPMARMLAMVADGSLRPLVGEAYPLSDARGAHEDMLARRTTGKVTLDPSR